MPAPPSPELPAAAQAAPELAVPERAAPERAAPALAGPEQGAGVADRAPAALQAYLLRPLLLPFVLMLVVGLAVLYGVGRNDESRAALSDSQTRLILLGLLSGDLTAMESAQRGYLLTGDPAYLVPLDDAGGALVAHLLALEDLSADAGQRADLARVQALAQRWQTEAAQPELAARRKSLSAAAALVEQGRGRALLDEARGVIGAMQSGEGARQGEALAAGARTLGTVRWVTLGGLTLGVALLLLTAWRVARTVARDLERLGQGAREIAAGGYHLRLAAMPVREVSQLGQQFNRMAAAVQEREQALRVSNEQLERSNRELEQFAYVASHDLQEPLRTIASYTELLVGRYQGQLDPRADKYMGFITSASQRLKGLIQDLLTFSRVRQGERPMGRVDVTSLVAGVLDDLGAQIAACGARVEVGPLPAVHGNPELLRHAFQNLIGNALKFCAPGQPPEVRVSATREPGRTVFHVQDHGIGIEPQYLERIFGVFQRLHGADEYPGSGIGLAVTRGAIERHGGELWVESTLGQGSTFHFSVPEVEGKG